MSKPEEKRKEGRIFVGISDALPAKCDAPGGSTEDYRDQKCSSIQEGLGLVVT